MLFNSYTFIFFFLPVTLVVYFILNKKRLTVGSNAWLLFASLFYYGWWNISYLPLILGSILFNYTISSLIIDNDALKKKVVSNRALFVFGIAVNIVFLCYFKYMDFFIGNINKAFQSDLPLLHIVLPLGISFFTITQIAFLVDSYEGLVEERKLLNYALFVTFFPHLLAGPILHHKEMMPQFDNVRNKVINYKNLSFGLYLFLIGLFKKVMIADEFSQWAGAGFDKAASLNLLAAWAASLSYTFQIYFDFSGYCDMAIGAGLMFNIKLPINFNSPYKALSIIDFWKRWHITLTNFVTTYLYTPILKSSGRITFRKSLIAIFIAMFISGLWHGAGWTFIFWGSLHGLALVVNHAWRKYKIRMNRILAWFITFNFVNFAFVFFRAREWHAAIKVLKGMAGMSGIVLPPELSSILGFLVNYGVTFESRFRLVFKEIEGREETVIRLVVVFLLALMTRNSMELMERCKPDWRHFAFIVALAFTGLLNMSKVSEFLYFNF
jgi:D-alanyl-lipoteichoic acid acyltransferase DltB (MBOAT superfamily)